MNKLCTILKKNIDHYYSAREFGYYSPLDGINHLDICQMELTYVLIQV